MDLFKVQLPEIILDFNFQEFKFCLDLLVPIKNRFCGW